MRVLAVFRKEVTDLLRDGKTIVVSLLVPLVLFPLSFGLMDAVGPGSGSRQMILYVDEVPGPFERLLAAQPEFSVRLGSAATARELLATGDLDAMLLWHGEAATVLFDSRRTQSVAAMDAVRALYDEFLDFQQRAYVPAESDLAAMIRSDLVVVDQGPGPGVSLLALLLPLLLLVAAAVSAMPSAADVAAGEKERSTIAPLLATSAAPVDLMLGKLLAVTALAAAGMAAFLGGIVISQLVAPGLFGETAPALDSSSSVAGLIGLGLLLTVFFASVELVVSLFADSPKETQAYLLPILIVSLGCGYAATAVDPLSVPPYVFHVPLVNVATSVKLLVLGLAPGAGTVWTALWMVGYIAVATTIGLLRISSDSMIL